MKTQRMTFTEALVAAPCWVCFVICAFGNIAIWLIIPEYLAGHGPGGVTGGMLAGGYAGAQPGIALMFNLSMALLFSLSLFESFVMRKRRGWSRD